MAARTAVGMRFVPGARRFVPSLSFTSHAQRAEAFRELALAEADDPIDPSADPVGAAVLPYEAAVAPSLPIADTDNGTPWRQASVPLHELPEDVQPADRDALDRRRGR